MELEAREGEGMPGRLPIGRFDTERSVRLLDALNFEPRRKKKFGYFRLFENERGGDPIGGWADMGTGGFGSSDGNRCREKRGRRGTPIMLCYVMLWILLLYSCVLRSLNLVTYLAYDIRPILSR